MDARADEETRCSALALVQVKCASCHAEEPVSDAPMPLVSAESFQADAVSDDTLKVHELALARVRDEESPMPPADADPLTDEERALLEAWLRDGARPAQADCEPPPPSEE